MKAKEQGSHRGTEETQLTEKFSLIFAQPQAGGRTPVPPTETCLPPWKIDLSTTSGSSKGISRLFKKKKSNDENHRQRLARPRNVFWEKGIPTIMRLLDGWSGKVGFVTSEGTWGIPS